MAVPNSREELKQYCLRNLGKPVINIEADDSQLEDRIDEALQTYQEKHYDAVEAEWVSYPLAQQDIDNGYLTLPENILTVNQLVDMAQLFSGGNGDLFSYQYQIALNELSPWQPFDQVSYFLKITNYNSIIDMTSALPSIVYTRHANKLRIYENMEKFSVGFPIGLNVTRILDPEAITKVYNDKWLKAYTAALFKKQWASNIKKYEQIQMLGGVTMNGQQLFDEAKEEIEKLETDLEEIYSEPTPFIMG